MKEIDWKKIDSLYGDMFDVDDPQIENASKPRNLACACSVQINIARSSEQGYRYDFEIYWAQK